MDISILQKIGIYLLVFAAVFLLIFLSVVMVQGISMEHYDRKVKDKTAGGHRNDIGYFVAPRVLLQIQISIGTLLMALIVAILLFPPLYASAIFPGRITLGGIRAALITGSAMILLLYPLYYTDHLKFHPAMLGVPAAGAALFLCSARERRAL